MIQSLRTRCVRLPCNRNYISANQCSRYILGVEFYLRQRISSSPYRLLIRDEKCARRFSENGCWSGFRLTAQRQRTLSPLHTYNQCAVACIWLVRLCCTRRFLCRRFRIYLPIPKHIIIHKTKRSQKIERSDSEPKTKRSLNRLFVSPCCQPFPRLIFRLCRICEASVDKFV